MGRWVVQATVDRQLPNLELHTLQHSDFVPVDIVLAVRPLVPSFKIYKLINFTI